MAVFKDSGFKRTLCDSTWESLKGDKNAFTSLGTSIARYGCCPANKYMSSPFTLYNNINTYVKETNIACGGGDNFDDIKNLDLVEFLGIHPAGAQLSARQTTQKCQDECDIRSWCTAFVYGTHGVSVAKSKLLFTGKECWLGKLQADTPPADKEVILQAGGATLEQCAKLCRQHATCHVFCWWPSVGSNYGRCVSETGVTGADDCNPVTSSAINVYKVIEGSRAKECWLHNKGCGGKATNVQFNYYTRIITPTVDSFVAANSCSPCPAGTHVSSVTSIPNDETSCQKCERGKCSAAGSTSCDLTCSKLPDGNGESDAAKRIGSFGGVIDDMDTKPKRHSKTQCYASQAELDAARLGGYGIRSYLDHEPRVYDRGQVVIVPLAECNNLCIADSHCKAFEFTDAGTYTTSAKQCTFYYACSILKPWSGGTAYIIQADTTKRSSAIKQYGPIENWDVSEVKNMKNAFYQTTLNPDISRWDVSTASNMNSSKKL